MSRRLGTGKRIVLVLIVLLIGGGLLVYLFNANDLQAASSVVQAVVGILTLTITLALLLPRKTLTIEDAARELAAAVRQQWKQIANESGNGIVGPSHGLNG